MRGGPRATVAIVGLGLIGGSLARDLTRAGFRVVGVDRPATLRRARRLGYVAATCATAAAAACDADVVVLAAPPRANLRLLREVARALRGAARFPVITDVGSVKRDIVRLAEARGLTTFVGGHPMAGSEKSGLAGAEQGLFAGRTWVLTPTAVSRPSALRAVRSLARSVGAHTVVRDAARHDRAVAFLSHLPQLVAWALASAADADVVARAERGLAGRGFRDMTRLARSPRPLWREIVTANTDEVRRALAAFRRALRARP